MIKRILYTLLILLATVNAYGAYYVASPGSGGSDSNSGTSSGSPWATLAKVNSTVTVAGSDVYLNRGDTWTEQKLVIDWTGTPSDRVVIGAYGTGADPIIDGNDTQPTTIWNGLINVDGDYDYITVENINLIDSAGEGIRFDGGADYCYAQNVTVSGSYGAAIIWYDGANNGLAENCSVTTVGIDRVEDRPFAIGGSRYVDSLTVRNCTITNSIAEGIGFYKGSDNCLAEYNLIYNAWSVGIYVDAGQYCTIRYNVVYGTTDTDYWRLMSGVKTTVGNGLSIDDERHVVARSRNNLVYGNYVAYCSSGMKIGCAEDGAEFLNSHVYNNTFIGCNWGIKINGTSFSNSTIQNNIIWLAGGLLLYNGASTTSGLTWSYNQWSQSSGAFNSGASTGDVIGVPDIDSTPNGLSDWRSLTAGNINVEHFAAATVETGTDVGSFSLLDADTSELPDTTVLVSPDVDGWPMGADPASSAPVISGEYPSGTLSCTADHRDMSIGITTNKTCEAKWSYVDEVFADMDYTFTNTNSTTHTTTASDLSCDTAYTIYVGVEDESGNLAYSTITFTIAAAPADPAITGVHAGTTITVHAGTTITVYATGE
jgi:parallel beta-helix repeat protein